jgi:hypothetical protein
MHRKLRLKMQGTLVSSVNYETIGKHYSDLRQPDPRIAKAIHAALGDLKSIVINPAP